MRNYILILTNSADESAEPVIKCLNEMEEKFYRFNTENFPLETSIKLLFSKDNFSGHLMDKNDSLLIDFEKIKSVWYRRPAPPFITNKMANGIARFIKDESNIALWSLYTTINAFWMNNPLIGQRLIQHNKLYQTKVASSVGLRVPDTIITNNADELLTFCKKHNGVIAIKLLKGNFFVKENSAVPLLVFTQKISEKEILERYDDIKMAPVLAQEYIEKEIELRITTIGRKIFTCAIHSQDSKYTKIDWRQYDFEMVKHEPYQLPKDTEENLFKAMKKWKLSFGAIDMILTPKGEYVFLEINPNGQWLWIEQLTGMPISKAIAETLANPPK